MLVKAKKVKFLSVISIDPKAPSAIHLQNTTTYRYLVSADLIQFKSFPYIIQLYTLNLQFFSTGRGI